MTTPFPLSGFVIIMLSSLRKSVRASHSSLLRICFCFEKSYVTIRCLFQLTFESTPGVLYGLPKIHKPGCPFRPIVSSVNTSNYNLASYVRILQPISTNQFTIKDSFSFADWAKTFNHNNEIMCSFDVSSLFTNVPLDETVQICLGKLYALPDPPTLPRSVLKVLLEFATKRSHFVFNVQYYDQIDGVAMGSPLGPVLANIFMCHFEEKWFLKRSHFCLVSIRRRYFHLVRQ